MPEPKLDNSAEGGQIIFQTECACLCGSDLPFFEHSDEEWIPEVGHSLHEMTGTVVATNGKKFKVGDRVLTVPVYQQGLFERYVVSEDRVIPLDKRVPEEQALLAQPLGTAIFALKKLPPLLDLDV
ncbi:MAG: alcohol dehydrogenase catalytic domain-containing protein, partial [Planctomycetaceae bacterium]